MRVAPDAVGLGKPQRQCVIEYRAIKRCLGAKVIMQIRFRQSGAVSNLGHGCARKTGTCKNLFGREQDIGNGRMTDVFLATRCCSCTNDFA